MPYLAESEIVVRYAETDRMGVVYHTNYLVWMEVGRTDYLAGIGHPYGGLEENGVMFPISSASIKLFKPCHYEDRLKVVTELGELKSRKAIFSYRIMRNSNLVVRGMTEHICTDPEMKVRKIPEEVFAALRKSMEG